MNCPLTTIGPYSVHLATPGWYCVIHRGDVVFTAASAAEAILWACIQHESETETEKEAIQ
jgi:hypothetical protein